MKRTINLFAGLLLALTGASAQNSTLEFLGGYSLQPFTINGETRSAGGAFNGGNAYLRYTYFFPGNFGVFAQIGSECVFGDETSFFGAMNKADGGKYLYRFSNYGSYESDLSVYSIGVAYRWDAGIFRFTPRLAVGVGDFSGYDYSYERRSRSGATGPEYFSCAPVRKAVSYDYLIDKRDIYVSPAPMLVSADFQISVMSDRRLFLFVQPGVTFAPFRINVENTQCGSVHPFNPTNWAEALAYSDASDVWARDCKSAVSSIEPCFISPFFHLNAGIGINFGYRNPARRNRHSGYRYRR